jgi:hypothetical protein
MSSHSLLSWAFSFRFMIGSLNMLYKNLAISSNTFSASSPDTIMSAILFACSCCGCSVSSNASKESTSGIVSKSLTATRFRAAVDSVHRGCEIAVAPVCVLLLRTALAFCCCTLSCGIWWRTACAVCWSDGCKLLGGAEAARRRAGALGLRHQAATSQRQCMAAGCCRPLLLAAAVHCACSVQVLQQLLLL